MTHIKDVAIEAGLLWADRFLHRMFIVAIVGLFASVGLGLVESHGDQITLLMVAIAGIWAIIDLARGIELGPDDAPTLRERAEQWVVERYGWD